MPFPLYALALAVFVMGTSEFMLAGLLPAIAHELDVPVGTAGLLTSAFAVGMVIGAPAMAAFARGWTPRRTLVACLALFAACHAVGAVTSLFELLLVTRVLSALANAGFLAVALRTVALLVPRERTGRALAVLLSGTTVATIVGVPVGAILGTGLSWRATFAAVALLCLPALLGILHGVPTTIRGTESDPAPAPLPRKEPALRAELALLRTPRLALAMTVAALVNAGTFAVFTFLAPIVTEVAGLPDAAVPLALVLFGIGSFLGVTIAGRFADRHAGALLTVGGPLLLGGWIVLAAVATQPIPLLFLVFVQGMASFGVGSTLITRVLYAASGAPTMGGSYATAALNLGAVIGPASGAWTLASGAGPLSPVTLAATLTMAALLLALATRRWRPVG
ncbi:Cmx/CmrA family chloramphenicol efflux MFS transporter [Microbacterium paraoxydans]|jgi:DHA1 family chloramphenicol resistance protein-like MFS transporter|uniref:Cmx/CmrA family chloramphenicol efflux MFS transporter n=1 Tax=Microbacterium TaxID=33882 RepID=UPI000D01EB83|nr:Cmx/CmrA family chloramphenicol efflux MFS transporter [Microbacterium sp. str. 'China']AVL97751.1 chloramphenicol efflux pump [Microbacterium sp. str. 'China']